MANPIVTVTVSQQVAPLPALLQKQGAAVSQGGTILAPNTASVLTQLSDLTPLLPVPAAISSIVYAGGEAQATTVNPHNLPVGQVVNLTIAGAVPAGYNGTYPCTVTAVNTFQYALPVSPGAETSPGTWVNGESTSLVQRATTFFAQGSGQAMSVLELGAGDATHGVAALSAWITANPGQFYGYLVPRFWDANAAFLTFLGTFTGTGAKTYFFVTTTLATYQLYAGLKSVLWLIEAPAYGAWLANALQSLSWSGGVATAQTTTNHGVLPGQWFQIQGAAPTGFNGWAQAQLGTTGTTLVWNLATNPGAVTLFGTLVQSPYASAGIGATEFSIASMFRTTLNYAPSSTNKVTPLNFAFENGVTPFPVNGNSALINTILAANGNIIGTGAAGGLAQNMVQGGKTGDGKQYKYWYSVDWVQINLQRNLTNALMNGANNPQAPLDYDQPGINTLQQRAVATMSQGISAALVLNPIKSTGLSAADFASGLNLGSFSGTTVVNADPFGSYIAENPNDYPNGVYNGISVDYTPLLGFQSITVNVIVTNFAG